MEENTENIQETTPEVVETSSEDTPETVEQTTVQTPEETVQDSSTNTEDDSSGISESIEETTEESTEDLTEESTEDSTENSTEDLTEGVFLTPEELEKLLSGIEEETEEIETQTEVVFLEKPLDEYTTSEGLLLLIFLLGIVAFVWHLMED